MIDTSALSLGAAQELFTRLENKWVAWCLEQPGWELRHGEGCILQGGPGVDAEGRPLGRRARDRETGTRVQVIDLVHDPDSLHYKMLADDWQLFVNGDWITRGDHPAWIAAGEKAEELGLSWGGRFADANHISLNFRGKQ